MQLRNQLNHRNVATNPDGRFNASNDFLELVIESHAIAAGMHFLGLVKCLDTYRLNMGVRRCAVQCIRETRLRICVRTTENV